MLAKVGICLLVVITLMVVYRLSGLSGCSNDKFYDKLNEERPYGSSMRSDQTFNAKNFLYIKERIKPWNDNPKNKDCKMFQYDVDKSIDVNDYSLVKKDEPIQMFFNDNTHTLTTYYNHRYVDAGKYFDFMKSLMDTEDVVLPDLKYLPYLSEMALVPYGMKIAKKFITSRTVIPKDISYVNHIHSVIKDSSISELKKILPGIKTKTIIAYLVINYILTSARRHKKDGILRVLFTVGFNRNNSLYKNVGNMIGGIVIDIPYQLSGYELMQFLNKNLKKEMSQAVHSLNFQISLPILAEVPKMARDGIDMIFSLSPYFKCGRMPVDIKVLVPFIIQPLYSLVLSCNDRHFIYLASMSSWIKK